MAKWDDIALSARSRTAREGSSKSATVACISGLRFCICRRFDGYVANRPRAVNERAFLPALRRVPRMNAMGMTADYGIDLDEVRRVVDAAEVLVIRFSVTNRRLLVDARANKDEGPMIKVVPQAHSAEERFRSVKMLRPRFRVPQRILTFHW